MSQTVRKRERLARWFGRQNRSVSTPELQPDRIETLACIRTVLNLAEKALDGCPIWGPKAAVAATAEGLKAIQGALENEASIQDVVDAVRKTVEMLAPSVSILPASVSPELKSRILAHVAQLEKIRASTKKWTKKEKNFKRRLLDAERVAKELEGVMNDIRDVNVLFLMETAVRTEVKIESIQEDLGDVKNDDLLDRLRPVKEAFHDASHASQTCLAGTRERLLANIYEWFQNTESSSERVFWLNGLAGTGKTTVARTIADRAHTQGCLAAAFFFSRNIAATRAPAAIIPTLVYQLAQYQPSFRSHICSAIASDKDVRDRAVAAQSRSLLNDLSTLNVPNGPLLVVLDALDECHIENGCEGGNAIPLLLARLAPIPSIKVLITSRAENTIKHMFDRLTNKLALHDIEADVVQSDIMHYLEHSLAELARMRKLPVPFPKTDVLEELVRRSGALFIYAATVVKWVSEPRACPSLRLEQILEQDADELSFQYKMLDTMYAQILAQAAETSGNPRTHERALKNVLSAVLLLQEPMHIPALASLAGEEKRAGTILPLLSAVLLANDKAPVRLFHPSFPDFIMDGDRCRDRRFAVVPSEGHSRLALRCLDIMNESLRHDICDIKNHSLLNSEIGDLKQRLASAVPDELRYACKYWHVHLGLVSDTSSIVIASLEVFCTQHLLHWVELLSLMGELSVLTVGIPPLLSSFPVWDNSRQRCCHALLSDAERLVAIYGSPIGLCALQVYHSGVATMPSCQLWDATVRHHLDIPQLTSARAGRWDTASRTIDTGSKLVCNIALSSCGRFLAVCQLGGVQVWDMTKGDHFYMIEHGWAVRAMFSPDGRLIASSGHESGIMLWATTTGGTLQCVLKLEDDNRDDDSTCMAFSPDNRQIASGHSASVRLWDVATGALQHVIETQQGLDVVSIAFSPSSHVLAWGNLNTEIYVRAITTGMQRPLNENHDSYIRAVALVSRAPDPSMLDDPWPCDSDPPPLDYRDPNILLDPHGFVVEDWCVQQSTTSTLQSAMDQFRCTHSTVVCSTDSKTATANNPRNHHETLGGCGIEHRMTSNAPIVFLPKNAPADTSTACDSSNHTERQKRTTTTTTQRQDALGSSKSPVVLSSIALSSDGRFVASGSVDGMVQLWDAETHEHLRLIGHCYTRIYRVTFSNGGETVASLSTDCIVRTWDPTNSFQYHGLVGHDGPILCIALSPNGRSIISGSADHTVRAWDATTGAQQWVMTEHCRPVTRIVFSHDGRLVVSCSDTTRVHCVATGFHPPAGPVSYIASNYVEMVRFSPNDKYILSQHDARDLGIEISTSVLCVWDATTGIDVCYSARGSKRGTLNVLMAGQVRDPALTALVRAYWKDKSEPLSPTLPCDVDTIKYEEDGWVWRIRNGGSGAHQRVCWLPAERRGRAWVARGHMLWVGGESGAITALNLEHVQAFESPSLPESYSANRPPEFFEVPDRPMDD